MESLEGSRDFFFKAGLARLPGLMHQSSRSCASPFSSTEMKRNISFGHKDMFQKLPGYTVGLENNRSTINPPLALSLLYAMTEALIIAKYIAQNGCPLFQVSC